MQSRGHRHEEAVLHCGSPGCSSLEWGVVQGSNIAFIELKSWVEGRDEKVRRCADILTNNKVEGKIHYWEKSKVQETCRLDMKYSEPSDFHSDSNEDVVSGWLFSHMGLSSKQGPRRVDVGLKFPCKEGCFILYVRSWVFPKGSSVKGLLSGVVLEWCGGTFRMWCLMGSQWVIDGDCRSCPLPFLASKLVRWAVVRHCFVVLPACK